jgi:hypothetical protein
MSAEDTYGKQFLNTYLNLMGEVWHSDEEEAKLLRNPTAFAIEKGLPVMPGATVQLDRSQPEGLLRSDDVIRDWTSTPGTHVLHVPAEEIINTGELTDNELELVSAGGNNNINGCIIVVIL